MNTAIRFLLALTGLVTRGKGPVSPRNCGLPAAAIAGSGRDLRRFAVCPHDPALPGVCNRASIPQWVRTTCGQRRHEQTRAPWSTQLALTSSGLPPGVVDPPMLSLCTQALPVVAERLNYLTRHAPTVHGGGHPPTRWFFQDKLGGQWPQAITRSNHLSDLLNRRNHSHYTVLKYWTKKPRGVASVRKVFARKRLSLWVGTALFRASNVRCYMACNGISS
jgi:hypothetical protein